MELTKPKVIKIAETRIDRDGVHAMLQALGVSQKGEERFSRMSDNGETLCELAGRMCYESFEIGLNPNVTKIREDSKEYFKNLLMKGDGSVSEHGSASFAFLGVSRIFTHELARHRVGIAISQESLRYVRPKEIQMWLPDDLDPQLREAMVKVAERTDDAYRELEKSVPRAERAMDTKKRPTAALPRIPFQGYATHLRWAGHFRTPAWGFRM